MKRLLILLMTLLVLLSGCGKNEDNSNEYYSFKDSLGNDVMLEHKPERVAVLFSSYAQIWTLAKGEISVTVGDSVKRGFVEEGVALVDDGAGLKLDLEALVAADPDFVVVTADLSGQVEAYDMMREMGIPSAALRVESVDDYLEVLKIFTDINGTEDIYEEYGLKVKEEVTGLISEYENEEGLSYLFIRAGSAFNSTKAKTADDHFACVMLDELGGKNIVEPDGLLTQELSLEEILVKDPDLIIIVCQGKEADSKAYIESLFNEDGWKDLRAIKDNNYYFVTKDLFNYKPNQNWAAAYKELINILY